MRLEAVALEKRLLQRQQVQPVEEQQAWEAPAWLKAVALEEQLLQLQPVQSAAGQQAWEEAGPGAMPRGRPEKRQV